LKHLLVDITAHGFGHLAQTAPVVNELVRRLPDLRVTVRSAVPLAILQQRFQCEFQCIPLAIDFGMQMIDAVEVDVANSLLAYQNYHANWSAKVAMAAAEMAALKPDVLLANVPYLSLAAAQQAGIPAVAMCCLNWAEIYRHYAGVTPTAQLIYQQMLDAYNSAAVFYKVQPTMPMSGLNNAQLIAPIAQLGRNRRHEIDRLLGLRATDKLVVVGMGGINYRLPMENWPTLAGMYWIAPENWQIERDDVISLAQLSLPFSDVLASCDAVLTKPGYGMFAEAACSGVPVLYVSRGAWPEQPYLLDWLNQHGVCREVTSAQLSTGDLADELQVLLSLNKPQTPLANGAEEVALKLLDLLCTNRCSG